MMNDQSLPHYKYMLLAQRYIDFSKKNVILLGLARFGN